MSFEIQFNSVVLQYEDIQKYYPELIPIVNSYLPQGKPVKRRRRKQKKTVGYLIDQIIETINTE